jgi:dihydroorotate dehydrogenase
LIERKIMAEFNGSLGQLDVAAPWANAGGVVRSLEEVEQIVAAGVGWVEAGSYTLDPRVGNGPLSDVYYFDKEERATYNSLGMPNNGIDAVEEEMPEMARAAHSYNKPLVVNVAPVSNEPVAESVELTRRAQAAGADMVLLNAGCPNVVTADGGRHELLSRNPKALKEVLKGLIEADVDPIAVRLSPMENHQQAVEVARVIRESGIISVVFTPNTWPGHKPLRSSGEPALKVSGNVGGKSGPATAEDAANQTAIFASLFRNTNIDVVSSGGITTADELARRLKLGAVAGAGTTFFYETEESWKSAVNKLNFDLASLL